MKKVFFLCIFVLIQSCNSTIPKQNLKSNLSLCPKDQNAFKHDCIGDFIYFGGGKYSGEWKNNKRHGAGVITYADDGRVLVGLFKENIYIKE